MKSVAIVGCGFVADLYMRSFALHPEVKVVAAYDQSEQRLEAFSTQWNVAACTDLCALLSALPKDGLLLNLTNPKAHYEVNKRALEADCHVFCEKPLALRFSNAKELFELASERELWLGSAPSSVLGEAAQTFLFAQRQRVAGTPRLVYAELDDGFISQAPVQDWVSESGAPWPYEDEFRVGCTLEHAGYYLSWLIAAFGAVKRLVAVSAETLPDKLGVEGCAPDFSVALIEFENGPLTRLTCSITAPHDHRLRMIGDKGVLSISEAWNNAAPVKFHKRMRLRRKLLEHPIGRRIKLKSKRTHPKVSRKGAAAMNFALGPVEMLEAIARREPSRIGGGFALHLTEITLALQNAGFEGGVYHPQSRCEPMEPMPWAR